MFRFLYYKVEKIDHVVYTWSQNLTLDGFKRSKINFESKLIIIRSKFTKALKLIREYFESSRNIEMTLFTFKSHSRDNFQLFTLILQSLSVVIYVHSNHYEVVVVASSSVRIHVRGVVSGSCTFPSHPFLPRVAIWIIHSVESLFIDIEWLKLLCSLHLILNLLQHNLQKDKTNIINTQ